MSSLLTYISSVQISRSLSLSLALWSCCVRQPVDIHNLAYFICIHSVCVCECVCVCVTTTGDETDFLHYSRICHAQYFSSERDARRRRTSVERGVTQVFRPQTRGSGFLMVWRQFVRSFAVHSHSFAFRRVARVRAHHMLPMVARACQGGRGHHIKRAMERNAGGAISHARSY